MATAGIGTKLKKGTTEIASLTSIGGLNISADTIETTTLDSDGWRTFIGGLKDAGEVPLSGYFIKEHKTFVEDLEVGTVGEYSIEFPPSLGASWTFNAIVTAFSTNTELEDAIGFEATLKVSGKPTLTITTTP